MTWRLTWLLTWRLAWRGKVVHFECRGHFCFLQVVEIERLQDVHRREHIPRSKKYIMNSTVRRAILGKVPVYGICDRHHAPHRALYGVQHPCGQTQVLLFTEKAHAYEVAGMLDGYRAQHGEYPPNDVLGFHTSAGAAWSGDLSIDELRLDLFVRHARGSGMGYSVIFDVDDDGTFLCKDLSLADVAHRRAFMERQLALPSYGDAADGGGGVSTVVPFFDPRNPLYRPKKK